MINSGYRRSLGVKGLLGSVLALLFIAIPQAALANKPKNIEESEMQLIPSYCPDTMGFKYGDAYTKTSPRAKHWVALMGESFWHMHHYCWGMINLNRARRAGVSTQTSKWLLEEVRGDFMYVTSNTPKNFVMLPEVYTRLGEVELMLRQPNRAIKAFERAIEQKPDYWPPYSHWAEFLMRAGKRPEALKTVIAGLAYSPESKVLLEQFKLLGGKPSDMPAPIKKSEPQVSPDDAKEPAEVQPEDKKPEEKVTTP